MTRIAVPGDKRRRKSLSLLWALLIVTLPTEAFSSNSCSDKAHVASLIQPYETIYDATFKGVTIDNRRTLTIEADNTYKVSGEMSVLFVGIREYTRFSLTDQGQVRPLEYLYERDGLGDKKDYHIRFDWEKGQAISLYKDDPWSLPIEPGMQDLLSQQVSFRLALMCDPALKSEYRFPITKKKRQRVYVYQPEKEEVIQTSLGKLRTIKFNKVETKPGRKTTVWLAKDWDYLIARLTYQDKHGSEHGVSIKTGTLGGKPIVPLE